MHNTTTIRFMNVIIPWKYGNMVQYDEQILLRLIDVKRIQMPD